MSNEMNDLDSLRKKLKQVISEKSYRENHTEMFLLASGKRSPYYFDLKQTLLHPGYLRMAATGMILLMQERLKAMPLAIGGLTMGADPLVYAISILAEEISGAKTNTVYPLIVRKQTKDHGSKKRLEGLVADIPSGAEVVLIDDVITTGKSTLEACSVIKEAGFLPRYAFCVLDRMEGGRENLLNENVELSSLFNLKDFSTK